VINWLTGQINDRNGLLEEAIASYEAVLSTRIPERGFDFSQDYEVINALGRTLYNRAKTEPLESTMRADFLARSVLTYRRTLAIDSENVDAQYGLGLAYTELARAENEPETNGSEPRNGPTAEALAALSAKAIDPKRSAAVRVTSARQLTRSVERFVSGPRPEYGSLLEPLHELVEALGPVWESAPDPTLKLALAKTLEVTHKHLYRLLKPDETAEGRAISVARKIDPAANQNAQSIVIHSLHRPGAPGLGLKGEGVAKRRAPASISSKDGEE
jgi:hypothetical protein